MNLPAFDVKKAAHKRLAELAKAAHAEHNAAARAVIVGKVREKADEILEALPRGSAKVRKWT